jgi:multiple sugar transport system permease protein
MMRIGVAGQRNISGVVKHVVVLLVGWVMIYPLIWMFMSSFKESALVFPTAGSLIPDPWVFRNYPSGWMGGVGGRSTFATFFGNSFFYAVTASVGAIISSAMVAYSFSRGHYKGKNILFALMLGTLMLPAQVLMIPQYLWFHNLGWVGTWLPLIVPSYFATHGFFIFLMTNFMNAIPRELDEAAKIDGCSFYGIFIRIFVPLSVPAFITSGLFSFIWRWDDFLGPLLYLMGRQSQFTVTLALRFFADPVAETDWGAMFAMGTLSLIPAVLIFIFLQRYLVEGISTTGLKG